MTRVALAVQPDDFAGGAGYLDTTSLGIDEVIARIEELVQARVA